MAIRTTPQSGSKEIHQKANSSSSSVVGSLIKSWRAPLSSKLQHESDGNMVMFRNSESVTRSVSVVHNKVSGGCNQVVSKRDKYFSDLDEDWSAVIDDCKLPIPAMANGGIGTLVKPMLRKQNSVGEKMGGDMGSRVSNESGSCVAHVSQLAGSSISTELRCQYEHEAEKDLQELNAAMQRLRKFDGVLKPRNSSIIKLSHLRKLSWNGVPMDYRPQVWKLLIGYLPANVKLQHSTLHRKRQEYSDGIGRVFSDLHFRDQPTWHQIEIDIPRTNPHIKLYQYASVQRSLQRILYLWAIRHPASGYVQGINDLVTPFYQVFLSEYLSPFQKDKVDSLDPSIYLTQEQIEQVEADCFWCLSKLVEQITDYYIHGQPGILNQVKHLGQLVKRIDADLYKHFQAEGVEFIQFAVRWMNCLLMREFQMYTVIRMWDTYLSETSLETSSDSNMIQPTHNTDSPPSTMSSTLTAASSVVTTSTKDNQRQPSLSEFHVFVCAAFLIKWSDQLSTMDFQAIITFLQNPPTRDWKEADIEMLLSEAYIWQSLYKDAISHWR